MTQSLIATYGPDIADKYGIVVGRMAMPTDFVTLFSQGYNGRFRNAVDIEKVEDKTVLEQNMNRLAAGLGYHRYTKLMKDIDLSKVIYGYGVQDTYVGKLNNDEIDFLKEHNATLVEADADHSEAIDITLTEVIEFFE